MSDDFNRLNPNIKIEILIYWPILLQQKYWGEFVEITITLIFLDHAFNSHVHSVLQGIDITRRNLMLITPTA